MKLNNIKKYIYLAPGGFTMPYTLGICQFIKENYNLNNINFIGSSAGSWTSIYLASDMYLSDHLINDYSKLFSNKDIIYKWHNICPFLISEMPKYINDFSFIDQKKIKISVSQFYNKSIINKITDDYDDINELFNLCVLSSYIPVLSGFDFPKNNNLITFDGYFSNPNLNLNENDEKNNLFIISNNMFNRKFTFSDVIGKDNINIKELVYLGYYDSMINKNHLDLFFD
jgi:hypothetical protein